MKRMPAFCALFFHRRAKQWGLASDSIPSIFGSEKGLKELAGIYTVCTLKNRKGIEYYLRSQEKWDPYMAIEWDNLVSSFILKLRATIEREPSRTQSLLENQFCRQPLKMPKLHCIAVHCMQLVESHVYLGAFTEQSFEHFQHTSSNFRQKRAQNKCGGGQILDDLQYSWMYSSPLLRKACADVEKRRSVLSRTIRKHKFPFE